MGTVLVKLSRPCRPGIAMVSIVGTRTLARVLSYPETLGFPAELVLLGATRSFSICPLRVLPECLCHGLQTHDQDLRYSAGSAPRPTRATTSASNAKGKTCCPLPGRVRAQGARLVFRQYPGKPRNQTICIFLLGCHDIFFESEVSHCDKRVMSTAL